MDAIKLRGTRNLYRIHAGGYRIVYRVVRKGYILIERIRHCQEAYRGLD